MSNIYTPGMYTVISDDNVNIRREPRIVESPVSNVVGQHTPGTQIEVFEILVDKKQMVWGRISEINPGTGKANWICIHTGNRAQLKASDPIPSTGKKTLKVLVNDVVVFELSI